MEQKPGGELSLYEIAMGLALLVERYRDAHPIIANDLELARKALVDADVRLDELGHKATIATTIITEPTKH
jgi:hypothetical protein